uniref:G-protein coupled receptors family 3 profile domain-containing protein n=1 Tax=Cyclopterus lumpus TaxID=8103 RepID=A0A8C2XSR3_CYCLU
MLSLLRFFVSTMVVFCPCSGKSYLHAHSHGDVMIGGLFPLHQETDYDITPGQLTCTDFNIQMFLRAQVMIYAIREINQRMPRVLPNLSIGYDIYDTCGDVSLAIRATLQLLRNQSDPQSCLVPAHFQTALPEPETKAVIGASSSEMSIAVARVLALSSVTQIGFAATSELLSRKLKFPTFLRTIPSDKHQTEAMVDLIIKFNWKTVVVIGSDDEHGRYGSDNLEDLFSQIKDVCVEFILILPGNFSLNNSTNKYVTDLMSKFNKSSAEAIILFTQEFNVRVILEAAIIHRLNRTWIATGSWSTSKLISTLPGIERVGEIFGFISKRNEVPGFRDYVISMFNGTSNTFLEYYQTHCASCSGTPEEDGEGLCLPTCGDTSSLANYIDQDKSYNIYLAVQVIARGLRSLLKCNNHRCKRSTEFTALKKVNLTVNNTQIFFDGNGDPSIGYDILYWNWTKYKHYPKIEKIGEYRLDKKIKLRADLVEKKRNVTVRSECRHVTAFNCSKTCKHGQELKILHKRCCFYCCSLPFAGQQCKRCRADQYSSLQRNECIDKTVDFLMRSDPFVGILSALAVLGIAVTVAFAVLFTVYWGTPVVKAVGGYLCLLELLSLLLCFCLTFSFAGKPTGASCMVGLPLYGIAFSFCIACILANLLQISLGFSFEVSPRSCAKRLHQPAALVMIVSGIQVALCGSWLGMYPPKAHQVIFRESILKQCEKGSNMFFIAMLAYNTCLAFICFVFAIKGRKLPDLYKNASLIAISMLLFLIVWVFLIPIYISLIGKYKRATESTAILISSYSILGCHLAPKCYIMVFRKELNNKNAMAEWKTTQRQPTPVTQVSVDTALIVTEKKKIYIKFGIFQIKAC